MASDDPSPIEDRIFEDTIPTDTFAILTRLKEIMVENGTNNLSDEVHQRDFRIHKLMWLLNRQFYGLEAKINLQKVWKFFKLYQKLSKVNLDDLKDVASKKNQTGAKTA